MNQHEQTTPARMCRLCGQAPARPKRRVCTRCSIAARLERLLDDGTGRINPALEPLARLLVNSPTPASTLVYLHKGVAPLLRELASGRLPLSHDGLRRWHQPRTVSWLRDLLITCQILPDVDRALLDIEAWLDERLEALAGHPHRRLLRQYALWQLLPKLRAKAQQRPLPPTAYQNARQQFTSAATFCTWLAEQQLPPVDLTQRDLDAWYAVSRVHQRQRVRGFLTWAIDTGRLPTVLTVPVVRFNTGPALTQQRRLELLHRYLHDTDTATATRAAVCLLLLFAQPLSRILRLTVDDITYDDHGGMLLRLGEPPTPVPEPFAALLADLVANREYLGGVANPMSRWLFPGRCPGQPLTYLTLLRRLRRLGFPLQQARASAVRELVLQVPAPVVADALGFHQTTTARQVAHAGSTWSRYPSGNRPS